MDDNNKNTHPDADRLSRIEAQLSSIEGQLADIRKIISSGHDVLFKANENRTREIGELAVEVNDLREKLIPTFYKVFPRHGAFLDKIEDVLQRRPKGNR